MSKLAINRRVLIVGEGRETEYNYFVGFRNAFKYELEMTATSISVVRGKGGNAKNIVERAINEAKRFQPNRKHGDRVVLLLDTEGEGRAPELPIAESMAKAHRIEIVYSCPSIEYWFLSHFPKPSRSYFKDCDRVIVALNKCWGTVCQSEYDKADQDVYHRLSSKLDIARVQALETDLYYLKSNTTACRVNPSSQIYELIATLIGVRTGEKCPITGTWKPIGITVETIAFKKGDMMPEYINNSVRWQLVN